MNDKSAKLRILNMLQFLGAALVYVALIVFVTIRMAQDNFSFGRIFEYSWLLKEGIFNTLIISGYSLLFGLILGFFLYLGRESKVYFVKSLANIFIEVMMGTPLLVLVFIAAYFIGPAFGYRDDYVLGIISITVYIGPYMANMFKSSIDSIDKAQFVVMDLYGFSTFKRYRYIILPQIFRRMLPTLMNNFTYAIKGSSLLYVVAVTEIAYSIKLIQSKNFAYTEGYLLLWFAYLAITLPLTLVSKALERRYNI